MAIILKKVGWENTPSKNTPVNATNLKQMENK